VDRKPGVLKIHVHPWGEIFVNGKQVPAAKRMDAKLSVPAGSYELRAVNPNFSARTKRVTVQPGQTIEWQVDFDE
jgi:eukaryotic-like serine/threonine-protein kinase